MKKARSEITRTVRPECLAEIPVGTRIKKTGTIHKKIKLKKRNYIHPVCNDPRIMVWEGHTSHHAALQTSSSPMSPAPHMDHFSGLGK